MVVAFLTVPTAISRVSASCSAVILERPVDGSIFRISAATRRMLELRRLSHKSCLIELMVRQIMLLGSFQARSRDTAVTWVHAFKLTQQSFVLFKLKQNCVPFSLGQRMA